MTTTTTTTTMHYHHHYHYYYSYHRLLNFSSHSLLRACVKEPPPLTHHVQVLGLVAGVEVLEGAVAGGVVVAWC